MPIVPDLTNFVKQKTGDNAKIFDKFHVNRATLPHNNSIVLLLSEFFKIQSCPARYKKNRATVDHLRGRARIRQETLLAPSAKWVRLCLSVWIFQTRRRGRLPTFRRRSCCKCTLYCACRSRARSLSWWSQAVCRQTSVRPNNSYAH